MEKISSAIARLGNCASSYVIWVAKVFDIDKRQFAEIDYNIPHCLKK